ncbi:MAG TPA: hypothetical protein VFV38_15115 [Ktedonobacteraceae bacterium]|nr:hypothetical protein [Ktedonobacteraceae bacterium]
MVSSPPLVLLQSICTIWTKASRGEAHATARNGTPCALALPALTFPFPEKKFLLHEVVYTERDHFQHPLEKIELREQADPFWYDCLRLSLNNQTLTALLEWERSEGVPRRSTFPRIVWSFQPDQWGCVTYNLRHSAEDHWVYKKYVISVGLLHSYSSRIFLEGVPTHTYRDMAQLR